MKKGKIFTNCLMVVWMVSAFFSFIACSADSDNVADSQGNSIVAEAPFSVVLKVHSENKDITSRGEINTTTLFVFDENNDFNQEVVVDKTYSLQAKAINIDCPGSSKITVVAWSGLSSANEEFNKLNQANIISDLQINLKQNNGVVTSLPSDLFYGQVTLNRKTTKSSVEELVINRKVSSLNLVTQGIMKVYDSKEGSYYYKIKKTKSAFNYNGELTGKDVEYIIPATLTSGGNLSAKTTILPSSDIAVELYRDNEMILSSENLQNTQKVSTNEGEQVSLLFDLSRKKCSVFVSAWGEITQHITVG